jgi:carboxymethylenebutenolidase
MVFPDAGGVRETFGQMGDRLASLGYVVLVPDIYYRAGEWTPFDVATLFTDPRERARMSGLVRPLTNDAIIADAGAYAGFLLARPEVSGSAIGTTGYCLGGRMSLVAAGGLGRTVAAVYVAGAIEDGSFTTEQAGLLDRALTGAGVEHTVEFYPARHGFAVPDNPTYDAAAEARHWEALGRLYRNHLGT